MEATLRFSLLALLLASMTSCHGQQNVPPGVELLADVEYGNVQGRLLHLEIARPKIPPARPMPVVFWIHGGGWEEGSHKPNEVIAFAGKGWFTASIEYRLSGEAKWPAQIEDCKLAIRWLRAHAAKWNIDPDRIGVCGISAGGHLAECLGVFDEKAGFDRGPYAGFSSRVQAVVATSAPSDFTPGSPPLIGAKDNRVAPVVTKLFGMGYDEHPNVWKQASPLWAVAPGDPPFLLFAGEADEVVPKAHSERFLSALQQAGVPAELVIVKNGDHVLLPARRGEPTDPPIEQAYQQIVKFFDRYLGD